MAAALNTLCIFRLSALGDITHMLPIIRTIQSQSPSLSITWIIGKLEFQLVENLTDIEFIIFDKSRGYKAYLDLYQQLRGRKFDTLLLMQVALRASLASMIIRADKRIGFDRQRSRDAHRFFCNQSISANPESHVLDGFFGFLQAIGIEQRNMQWDLPISPDAVAYADQKLGTQPTLVINACTSVRSNNFRNWRAEYYAAVADYAAEKYQLQIVLTGGPADVEIKMAEQIQKLAKKPIINLVGATTIQQMLAVLKKAKVIVAPDTGPAHMGTAVGTPVIGLYVTSNPDRSGPYKSRELTVNRYPDAVKKYLGISVAEVIWGQRVRNPEAVELITITDVTNKLDQLMTTAPINL